LNLSVKKLHLLKIAVLGSALFASHAWAQAVDAGKTKALQVCAVCHGPAGITTMANTPNLAGQPDMYLAQQLRDYKSGKRSHAVMAVIAQPLTDEEIANLAAFYASVKIKIDDGK
jgi:cytochrome c553